MTARGSSEGVAYPRDGTAHRTGVAMVALDAQVAVPARARVQSFDERAHERKMTDVQPARDRLYPLQHRTR
jgi:hypothetical protein